MIFCWLFGHRYDYDIKKTELLALVCTRCGNMRVLHEIKVDSRFDLSSLPPDIAKGQRQYSSRA